MSTVAQHHRVLVAEMDEAGDSPAEIAKKLGISAERVEAILDQLDETDGRPAHPDDEHRAPAVEPVAPEPRPATKSGPIVVGSPARAPAQPKPVVVQPVPDWPPDETTYRPTYLGPVDVPAPTVLAEPEPAKPAPVRRRPKEKSAVALTAEIEWADPPRSKHGVGQAAHITAIVNGLKENPGRWAAVQRGMRTSSGARTWIKRGCEAVCRREEAEPGAPVTWTVYARWPA